MTQKIFAILGATGHIGHIIVEDLLKRGYVVRAIGRDIRKLHQLESKGAIPISLDFEDSEALAEAFSGAYAVFAMIPPGYKEEDYAAYQDSVGKAIVTALQKANIQRVVNLSSIGADQAEGTGPIKGLNRQEERLNALKNLTTLIHLRPGYFMENLYSFLPMVQQGVICSPLPGDLKLAMVATRDVGWKAAEFLDSSPQLREFFDFAGPKEVSLNDVTALFAQAFDYPELQYQQISFEEDKQHMIANGITPGIADLMVEMEQAFADGRFKPTQELTKDHCGTTTLETFVEMIAHRTLAVRH